MVTMGESQHAEEATSATTIPGTSCRQSARLAAKSSRNRTGPGEHARVHLATCTRTELSRRGDEEVFWRTIAQLSPPRTPSQLFDDLHRTFVGSYWSTATARSLSRYIDTYHWKAPRSPALNASRDALCLLHVGTRYGDQRLLLEARARHCAALKCLRTEIQRPGAVYDDSILGACYTIAQCEVYKVVSRQSGGWQIHLPGILAVFRQRGAKSIRSPFARAVLHNVKNVVAMHGVLVRKRGLFGSTGWSNAADHHGRPAIKLTNIFFKIGSLLEETDNLRARGPEEDETKLVSTLTALTEIEGQLQQWLLELYRSTSGDAMPYKEVSLSRFPSFMEHSRIAHTFPKVFEFPDLLSATSHIYVWIGLLSTRQAITDVARLHPYPL
ncbi:hypothetical protein LTR53_015632, partial [Teratosphaeriaceae sp. CCFEE 6253]